MAGIPAAVAAVAGVLGVAASLAFIFSIVPVIVFRIWTGIQLARASAVWREARHVDRAA